MKKSICFIVAVAAGFILQGLSFGQDVSSVNVVGYNKITLPSNTYVMVGVQFDSMTNGAVYSVGDILGTNGFATGTIAMGYDGSNYIAETYNASTRKWYPSGKTNYFVRGDAMWVKTLTATNFSLMGQVPTNSTFMILDKNYNMVTYPFPVDTTLTNDPAGLTAISSNAITGDTIMKYTGSNYQSWVYSAGTKTWYPSGHSNPIKLSPGEGFWFKAQKGTNLTEKAPYSLQ